MKTNWCVVANGTKALFFDRLSPKGDMQFIHKIEHSEYREKDSSFTSDRQGLSFDSNGDGRHGMEPHTTITAQQLQQFSREICQYLEDNRAKGVYDRVLLVVEPRLLGQMRKDLSSTALKTIMGEVGRDLTHETVPNLKAHVGQFLSDI